MTGAFVKMHGLGNDFVVVDRREAGSPPSPGDAVALCDRHRGIGADGVLSILPSGRAPIAMHVTNADGSVAEMCGNGLRCVTLYAAERGLLPRAGGPVETGRGVLECTIESDGEVRVDMGEPLLDPARVPVLLPGPRVVSVPIDVAGERVAITAVSMGNPHAVVFVPDGAEPRAWAERLGPAIERHSVFPKRANAGFARFGDGTLHLVVWERGAGFTQACGTGACAAVVAAVLTERARAGEIVRVSLPGGFLRIRVEPDLSRVWMTGPAVEVYRGTLS
jgi:diaminopimelate epimerase